MRRSSSSAMDHSREPLLRSKIWISEHSPEIFRRWPGTASKIESNACVVLRGVHGRPPCSNCRRRPYSPRDRERWGFGCRNASSGEEAISLLNADSCQALIVDIGFGHDHVKGWSVARRARAFDPSLPVIYITGGSTDEWAVHGVPSSILLTKPFALAQLLAALSQLLNKPVTPVMSQEIQD